LEPRIHESAGEYFADLFFYLLDAAEFDAGGAAGFVGAHPVSDLFIGEKLEIRMHLVVEFTVRTAVAEQIAGEAA
jgi:hypothetical protein